MPNDPQLAATVVALLTTYLLHSTLLLGAVWLGVIFTRARSAVLQERLWKLAALAPLITAPLQLAAVERFADWSIWTLPAIELAVSSRIVELPPEVVNAALWEGDATAWEDDAPAEPPGTADIFGEPARQEPRPPDLESGTSPWSEVHGAADAEGATHVQIVPESSGDEASSEPGLPTIEPAEPTASAPSALADVLIEPAATTDSEIANVVPFDGPTAIAATPPMSEVGRTPPVNIASPSENFARGGLLRHQWRGLVSLAFAALATIGGLRLIWRSLVAHRRLRRTETISDGALRDSLDRLLAQRNIRRRVRLATSTAASEPAAGGVLRWTIVVPAGIDERLTPAEQQALLAHELAHLVRRDPLWLWIGTALCLCLPFQLLNFLAVRRWRQAAEELCDDWAVAAGVRPLTLANCLTRVAEWRLAPMPLGLTADVGKSRFARRIGRLVSGELNDDHWSRPARRRLLLAGAVGSAAVLTVFGPRMQAGPTREEPPWEAGADDWVAGDNQWVAGAGLSAAKEAPDDATASLLNQFQRREPPAVGDDEWLSQLDASPAGPDDGTVSTPGLQQEIASLLADLERVDAFIGELADDPEIEAARAGLRARLATLRSRLQSDDQSDRAAIEQPDEPAAGRNRQ